MEIISKRQLINSLRTMITETFSQADMAKQLGYSQAMVSAVLNGKKQPPQKMLKLLKLRRIVVYKRT